MTAGTLSLHSLSQVAAAFRLALNQARPRCVGSDADAPQPRRLRSGTLAEPQAVVEPPGNHRFQKRCSV